MRARSLVINVAMALLLLGIPAPTVAAPDGSGSASGGAVARGGVDSLRPGNAVPNGQGLGPWPLLL